MASDKKGETTICKDDLDESTTMISNDFKRTVEDM